MYFTVLFCYYMDVLLFPSTIPLFPGRIEKREEGPFCGGIEHGFVSEGLVTIDRAMKSFFAPRAPQAMDSEQNATALLSILTNPDISGNLLNSSILSSLGMI